MLLTITPWSRFAHSKQGKNFYLKNYRNQPWLYGSSILCLKKLILILSIFSFLTLSLSTVFSLSISHFLLFSLFLSLSFSLSLFFSLFLSITRPLSLSLSLWMISNLVINIHFSFRFSFYSEFKKPVGSRGHGSSFVSGIRFVSIWRRGSVRSAVNHAAEFNLVARERMIDVSLRHFTWILAFCALIP